MPGASALIASALSMTGRSCAMAGRRSAANCAASTSVIATVFVFVIAVVCIPSQIVAQDRVVIQRAGSGSRIGVSGRIQDYTGKELVLFTGVGDGVQRFPFDEVIDVTTRFGPAHDAGAQALQTGRLDEAWAQLSTALEEESRRWVRREILALQVRCALRLRNYSAAINRFLAIAQSDPLTPHYRLIPLVWTESAPAPLPIAELRAWHDSSDLTSRLIGASWLLFGPDHRAAESTLQALARESDISVQRLAQAQLWRLRLAADDFTPAEVTRWTQVSRDWPKPLQSGVQFLIARGHAAHQDWLSAAAAWLWLPFQFADRWDLALEAQWRAVGALDRFGDNAAARRLAQELVDRDYDSPQAESAREFLRQQTAGK